MIGWGFHFFNVLPNFTPHKEQIVISTYPFARNVIKWINNVQVTLLKQRENYFLVNRDMYIFQRNDDSQEVLEFLRWPYLEFGLSVVNPWNQFKIFEK